jgi:hypothetical protein
LSKTINEEIEENRSRVSKSIDEEIEGNPSRVSKERYYFDVCLRNDLNQSSDE